MSYTEIDGFIRLGEHVQRPRAEPAVGTQRDELVCVGRAHDVQRADWLLVSKREYK